MLAPMFRRRAATRSDDAFWTFVSIPDFLNLDVGDVRSAVGWRPGMPNSTNAAYETLISQVLDSLASEQPDLVLVAGDLVGGLWLRDGDNLQVFGPLRTLDDKRLVIQRAGELYYGQWKQRFAERRLAVHAALGDHEIGDNPWHPGTAKHELFPAFRDAWVTAFTRTPRKPRYPERPTGTPHEGTAYALRHRDTMIVTVDVFSWGEDGVTVAVSDGQLRWLADVLGRAQIHPGVRHIIVQGHVPVLTPVRRTHSSGLVHEFGPESDFWQSLVAAGADLYLCGEVHDVTASEHSGVVQLAHGANVGRAPRLNYLIGRVYPQRIELEIKQVDQIKGNGKQRLWQQSPRRPKAQVTLGPNGFQRTGSMTIESAAVDGPISARSGILDAFDPEATRESSSAPLLGDDRVAARR
jgi:hypothetical protein